MKKISIFSAFLVTALIVTPVVSSLNLPYKDALADASSISSVSSSLSQLSSVSDLSSSSSIADTSLSSFASSDSSSSALSSSSTSQKKGIKSFAIQDVKPAKLAPASTVWWKEIDTFSGGNSLDTGVESMNTLIQEKLNTLCPNIYNTITKTVNDANLANCAAINSLPIQKIGVIDSGVNATTEMQPFMDQANSWKYFTNLNDPSCTSASPLLFATALGPNNSTNYYCKERGTQTDTDYHGTATAYVAIQMFKNSLLKNKIKIVPVSLQTLDTISIADSIDQLTADGLKIINMSLGTPYDINYLETAVNDAVAAGVVLYGASGNCAVYTASNCEYDGVTGQTIPQEADNAPNYPAAYLNATMVGSTTYSDNNVAGIVRAGYSNFVTSLRSKFVTAPVGNNGIVLPCFYNCPAGVTSYGYLGTSFAAPQVSGLNGLVDRYTALLKINLGQPNEKVLVSNTTVESYINSNTTDVSTAGNDLQTGLGLINTVKTNNAIVAQVQTLNVPVSSSSAVAPSSSAIVASSSTVASSSAVVASSSAISSVVSSSSSAPAIPPTAVNTVSGYPNSNPGYTLCIFQSGMPRSTATIVNGPINANPSVNGTIYYLFTTNVSNSCSTGTQVGVDVPYISYPKHNTTVPVSFSTIGGLVANGTPTVANQSPVFSGNNGSTSFSVCMGSTGSFDITFIDPDGDALQPASNSLPSGLTFSTNSVENNLIYTIFTGTSITTTAGVRDFNLTVQEVANSYQSGPGAVISQQFSLNVINCNPPSSSAQVVTPISSVILVSSSNVQSSSTNTILSSSSQVIPASSTQVSSSSQAVSTVGNQVSSAVSSVTGQSSTSVTNPNTGGATVNGGGSVISIIAGVIGNAINSLTGNNANTSGNFGVAPSSTSTNNTASPVSNSNTTSPIITNLPKSQEDAVFDGLVNNPNGSNNPTEVQNQSNLDSTDDIRSQPSQLPQNNSTSGGFETDNKKTISSNSSSTNSNSDECRKGWDGTVKGQSVNEECDDTIPVAPQTDINSDTGNDIGKFIPIIIITLLGAVAALATTGLFQNFFLRGLTKATGFVANNTSFGSMAGGAGPSINATGDSVTNSFDKSSNGTLKTKHDTAKNSISNVR